jgi:ATP-dependent DNA helicase RecQ
VLFYSGQDTAIARFMIDQVDENNTLSPEELEAVQARDRERLKAMVGYCKTPDCFRKYILDYFSDPSECECGNCGNCLAKNETATKDITIEAQKILSCVSRMREHFGASRVVEVLRGSKSQKVLEFGFDRLSTYGIMAESSEREVRDICNFLVTEGYLQQTDDQYPVLKLTQKSRSVLFEGEQVTMRYRADMQNKGERSSKEQKPLPFAVDPRLFASLKALRGELARAEGVPAYVIFHDAALAEMCAKLPQNEMDFLSISGVGKSKLEKYGERFLAVVRDYL